MRKLVLLGLFGLTQLSAFGDCGDFGASLDYLYWKPANSSVNTSTASKFESGKQLNSAILVDPTYNSGVRGEVWWRPQSSCVALIGRYYYVESRQSQPFFNVTLPRGIGPPPVLSTITLSAQTPYHAADVLISYPLCLGNCLQLNLLAGGHFLYWALDVQQTVESDGESSSFALVLTPFESHSRFSGGGASLGVSTSWSIWCGLHTFVEARFGVMRGSNLRASLGEEHDDTLVVNLPSAFRTWTRELDLRLGARYDCQLG
jgi:Legionella pneumophila major outer membrane protein precursor